MFVEANVCAWLWEKRLERRVTLCTSECRIAGASKGAGFCLWAWSQPHKCCCRVSAQGSGGYADIAENRIGPWGFGPFLFEQLSPILAVSQGSKQV